MFVQYLNERQQGVLLHFAQEMIRADRRVTVSEQALVESLRAQMRPGVVAEAVQTADLGSMFEDRPARIAFLLELVGVAFADESMHSSESAFTKAIANALELGKADIEQAESWVSLQMALLQRAHKLMEGS